MYTMIHVILLALTALNFGGIGNASVIRSGLSSSFSVRQIANPSYVGYVASGPAALEKTYAKFNKHTPQNLISAIKLAKEKFQDQGSVANQPELFDSAYLCPVGIGSPPQQLFLDFDTGSSDLWVFSSETDNSQVKRQALYRPEKSATARKLKGATWTISYGDKSAADGDVWIDNINIGGVVVRSQAVEAAKHVTGTFTNDSPSSGLLGLGFGNINRVKPHKQSTFFDNTKGVLASPIFAADLKAGALGTYDFGYIDTNKVQGRVEYADIDNTQGYWKITSPGYAVGSGRFVKYSIDAIVDTGTSLLLLPDDVVQDYYSKVNKSTYSTSEGGWIFPCENKNPTFVFSAGSYHGTVPGNYINYAPAVAKRGYCFGGIQSDVGIGFSIFGDVLLKSQYVVFDAGNVRVGFAPKKL
ncbi:hypothetical protein ACHAPA_012204 [Fusarium lateritium]